MQLDSKCIIFAGSRTSDMGNFERSNTVRKEREERDFKVREKLSGFFFDLAKLVFAGTVVGNLSSFAGSVQMIDNWFIFLGMVSTAVIATIGYRILR